MRILCSSHNLFHFRGHEGVEHVGSEVNFHRYIHIAVAYRKIGHSVFILALDTDNSLRIWPKVKNFEWQGLSVWTIIVPKLLRNFEPLFFITIFPFYLFWEYWLVKKLKIKLIRAEGYIAGPTSVLLRTLTKIKVLYEDVDDFSAFENNPFYKKVIRYLEKIAIKNSDLIVCASDVLRKMRYSNLRRRNKRIIVLSNGVDTETFQPMRQKDISSLRKHLGLEDYLVLLFVGRLYKYEGTSIAIKAVSLLNKKAPVRLIIVGDGPEFHQLQRLAENLGIRACVKFIGYIDNKDVAKYIAIADVCLMPLLNLGSVYAVGFPSKLMEYLAVGKPVVASEVADLKETIKEVGITVPPNDPIALASAILDLQKKDLEKMSKRALLMSKKFDWKRIAAEELKNLHLNS